MMLDIKTISTQIANRFYDISRAQLPKLTYSNSCVWPAGLLKCEKSIPSIWSNKRYLGVFRHVKFKSGLHFVWAWCPTAILINQFAIFCAKRNTPPKSASSNSAPWAITVIFFTVLRTTYNKILHARTLFLTSESSRSDFSFHDLARGDLDGVSWLCNSAKRPWLGQFFYYFITLLSWTSSWCMFFTTWHRETKTDLTSLVSWLGLT